MNIDIIVRSSPAPASSGGGEAALGDEEIVFVSSSGGLGGDLPHPRALCPFEKFEPLGPDPVLWQVVKVSYFLKRRGNYSKTF